MSERERIEAVIWHFLLEAEPEWGSGKCAIYAEDLAGRVAPLLGSEPVGEPVAWQILKDGQRIGNSDGYRDDEPYLVDSPNRHRYSVRPLYAAPPAATEAQEPER